MTWEEFSKQKLGAAQHCSATKKGNHKLTDAVLPLTVDSYESFMIDYGVYMEWIVVLVLSLHVTCYHAARLEENRNCDPCQESRILWILLDIQVNLLNLVNLSLI